MAINPTSADGDAPRDTTADLFLSDGVTRLVLSGDIDAGNVDELAGTFAEAAVARGPVQVDARHLGFVDSSGLTLFARLAAAVPVTLIDPPETLRFLIDLTRLGGRVTVVDSDPGFPPPAA